ncbi:hypothetical protein ACERII_17640 [Evansella sp. AB-rgal1]|uniref:hypothetical protein n=1 Tax=Evansella sp. AB-rgal1 TaxID=3242696 RepID=UPI00359CBAB2
MPSSGIINTALTISMVILITIIGSLYLKGILSSELFTPLTDMEQIIEAFGK